MALKISDLEAAVRKTEDAIAAHVAHIALEADEATAEIRKRSLGTLHELLEIQSRLLRLAVARGAGDTEE